MESLAQIKEKLSSQPFLVLILIAAIVYLVRANELQYIEIINDKEKVYNVLLQRLIQCNDDKFAAYSGLYIKTEKLYQEQLKRQQELYEQVIECHKNR